MRYASLRQGLVGCWCPSVSGPFGYRLPDLSGYGNHGTLTNMDPGTDWVASGGKGALDFDGTNDTVTIPDRNYLLSLQVPLTISAWAYKTSGTNGSVLAQYQNVSNSQLVKLAAFSTTEFAYYTSKANGGFQRVAYSTVPAINQWHCLTWVVSGSLASPVCRIGQNGIEQTFSLAALSQNPDTSVPLRIAGNFLNLGVNNEYNLIQLDDIRIYNRALSESEIRLLASGRGVGLIPERNVRRYYQPPQQPRNRSSRFLSFPA